MHNVLGERRMMFSEPHFDQRGLHLSISVCISETEQKHVFGRIRRKALGNMEITIRQLLETKFKYFKSMKLSRVIMKFLDIFVLSCWPKFQSLYCICKEVHFPC
jgi:hypothetical protein